MILVLKIALGVFIGLFVMDLYRDWGTKKRIKEEKNKGKVWI